MEQNELKDELIESLKKENEELRARLKYVIKTLERVTKELKE